MEEQPPSLSGRHRGPHADPIQPTQAEGESARSSPSARRIRGRRRLALPLPDPVLPPEPVPKLEPERHLQPGASPRPEPPSRPSARRTRGRERLRSPQVLPTEANPRSRSPSTSPQPRPEPPSRHSARRIRGRRRLEPGAPTSPSTSSLPVEPQLPLLAAAEMEPSPQRTVRVQTLTAPTTISRRTSTTPLPATPTPVPTPAISSDAADAGIPDAQPQLQMERDVDVDAEIMTKKRFHGVVSLEVVRAPGPSLNPMAIASPHSHPQPQPDADPNPDTVVACYIVVDVVAAAGGEGGWGSQRFILAIKLLETLEEERSECKSVVQQKSQIDKWVQS
ncbi:hypothetical protein B0H16DRAFT_1699450 [Mycena metata]|uniref:Uncharacterized protein n=1 Tax=Mycena metata TaxID=1033252 RepID=A0AAD7HKP7_9AGAR|nr:hypothetical protein B0H16DRAFT_1699450 [Mycena metata]